MLCSTYHGGGSNTYEPGEPDSVRTLAALATSSGTCARRFVVDVPLVVVGYLTPLGSKENQYVANDVERIKTLPIGIQALAGWEVSLSMGFVDFITSTSSELTTSRFASGWVWSLQRP